MRNIPGRQTSLKSPARVCSPMKRLNPLIEEFNKKVGEKLSKTHGDCGLLLACAIYDKACGVEKAITSFLVWARNEDAFPPQWIRAVDEAIEKLSTLINS